MKNWKTLLGLVLIFGLGMAAGGLITGAVVKRTVDSAIEEGPKSVGKTITARLAAELSLDPTQKTQLAGIVTDAQQEIQSARAQIQPRVKAALSQSERRIRAMLTPEQDKKFDRIVERNRKKARAFDPLAP